MCAFCLIGFHSLKIIGGLFTGFARYMEGWICIKLVFRWDFLNTYQCPPTSDQWEDPSGCKQLIGGRGTTMNQWINLFNTEPKYGYGFRLTLQLQEFTGVWLVICWICTLDHLKQLVHFLLQNIAKTLQTRLHDTCMRAATTNSNTVLHREHLTSLKGKSE